MSTSQKAFKCPQVHLESKIVVDFVHFAEDWNKMNIWNLIIFENEIGFNFKYFQSYDEGWMYSIGNILLKTIFCIFFFVLCILWEELYKEHLNSWVDIWAISSTNRVLHIEFNRTVYRTEGSFFVQTILYILKVKGTGTRE